jgi:hypothetical protein
MVLYAILFLNINIVFQDRSSMTISIQASVGEVVDKVSILNIKVEKLTNPEALENVSVELGFLKRALKESDLEEALSHSLFQQLAEVNLQLWQVEDELREFESKRIFDAEFIELARSVYKLNDRRAAIKRDVNLAFDSKLMEEKSYKAY